MRTPLINLNKLDAQQGNVKEAEADISMLPAAQVMGLNIDKIPLSVIPERLSEFSDIEFVTNGKWSLHELVAVILERYHPVSISLSTFSFTEFPARVLAAWKSSGWINELNILLDGRAKANYPEVLQLVQNIADRFRLVPVHAKATVIEHSEGIITITGSANWTQNPRFEIGNISQHQTKGLFHKAWILGAINRKKDERKI